MKNRLARRLGDKPQPQQRGPEVVHPPFGAEPPPPTDQREQRAVRQSGGSAPPCTGFSLPIEFGEQLAPIETRIAALPRPLAMRAAVLDIANAVDTALLVVAELVLESPGATTDAQQRASRISAELAARAQSEEPVVTDQMIASGTWATTLIARAELLADDLAGLLGRAHRPGSAALGGDPSIAERVEQVLRRLDRAARDAHTHLGRVAHHQSLPRPEQYNAQRRAEAAAERVRQAQYEARLRAVRRTLAASGARS